MNKFLFSAVTAATLLGVAVPVVHAASPALGAFTVSTTLSSQCEATSTGQALTFAYTAFRTTDLPASGSAVITFRCSRNLIPVSVAFDTGAAQSNTTTGTGTASTATGSGVLAGLKYDLSVAAGQVTQAGASASTTSIGDEKIISYTVTGNMLANQAGDATSTTLSETRYVVVSY